MTTNQQIDTLFSVLMDRLNYSAPTTNGLEDWAESVQDYHNSLDWDYGIPSATVKLVIELVGEKSKVGICYQSGTGDTDFTIYNDDTFFIVQPRDILHAIKLANTLGFDFHKNKPLDKNIRFIIFLVSSTRCRGYSNETKRDIQKYLVEYFQKRGLFELEEMYPQLWEYLNKFGIESFNYTNL